jgi:hypothetical protein
MGRACLAGLALCFVAGQADAQLYLGTDLVRVCTMSEDQSDCIAYMGGVADSFDLIDRLSRSGGLPSLFCFNAGVAALELRDVTLAYAKDHPTEAGMPAADLVLAAVKAKYPCPS